MLKPLEVYHTYDPWTGDSADFSGLKEGFYKLRKKFKRLFGPKGPRKYVGGVGFVALIIWLLGGICRVGTSEQAVVMWGGHYNRTLEPGIHWVMRPVERVYKVNKEKVSRYVYKADFLTRDAKIVSLEWVVHYKINDAMSYLFASADPVRILQNSLISHVRHEIGRMQLEEVVNMEKGTFGHTIKAQLKATLENFQTGLQVTCVTLGSVNFPQKVMDACHKAREIEKEAENTVAQANVYAINTRSDTHNKIQQLLHEAVTYQAQVVSDARIEVAPFLALLPLYEKAPLIIRNQLAAQNLEAILSQNQKLLVYGKEIKLQLRKDIARLKSQNSMLPIVETTNPPVEKSNDPVSEPILDPSRGYE
jgi:membrane protease subunit HflK